MLVAASSLTIVQNGRVTEPQVTTSDLTIPHAPGTKIGILTSGGDAPGMNAAVRGAVRAAYQAGAQPYGVFEGWQGAVEGGSGIRPLRWEDVGNLLHAGGTAIGTARCPEFRDYDGRQKAAQHLLEVGIDRLICIGGDGSLTGADEFREEWPQHVQELLDAGTIDETTAKKHPQLMVTGLVGSIDNDMVGTDSTIGADTALHRIVEAIDAIVSTAASHQRSFVIEVMGRRCGYLALMAAVAGGCDYVFVPEAPPQPGWEAEMTDALRAGRAAGRRDSIVLVSEGARDHAGNPITAEQVKDILVNDLNEDVRVTILGHVQRGGRPSAYDRWMSSLLGIAGVIEVLTATPDGVSNILGVRNSRITRMPLNDAVDATRAVEGLIKAGKVAETDAARGSTFTEMRQTYARLAKPVADRPVADNAKRIAIMHCGGLAPGMNTAVHSLTRLGLAAGHEVLGITGGFAGLIDDKVAPLKWRAVDGWWGTGGAALVSKREEVTPENCEQIAQSLNRNNIDALVMVGGISGYRGLRQIETARTQTDGLNIPMICIPATIDNTLPGSDFSIGTDSALNCIVESLDRIRQSASAQQRCFVVETMGRYCGYLATLSGIAAGAERVYLHEKPMTIDQLREDVDLMRKSFAGGRRLFLALRNEFASDNYTTDFLTHLFDEESDGRYDVRSNVLGHVQQGGQPTPFDRVLATRLGSWAIDWLTTQLQEQHHEIRYVGVLDGKVTSHNITNMDTQMCQTYRRRQNQWWLPLHDAISTLSDAPQG